MKKHGLFYLLGLSLVLMLSGCVVRTYSVTKDRVDQDLSAGNRGFLKGEPGDLETKERKAKRTTQVIEIEMRSPLKFEKMPGEEKEVKKKAAFGDEEETTESLSLGNRGYITESVIPEMAEPEESVGLSFEKYTVGENDTLQKISQKFYGTTKKWQNIYEANKDFLKGPDKIYPGQVIKIPVEKK